MDSVAESKRDIDDSITAMLELLRANKPPAEDRRRVWRRRCRSQGSIRMIGMTRAGDAEPIFVCDANNWGIGFLTRAPILLGGEGTATIVWPDGRVVGVDGYVLRSSEIRDGWRHSALLFFQAQSMLQYLT